MYNYLCDYLSYIDRPALPTFGNKDQFVSLYWKFCTMGLEAAPSTCVAPYCVPQTRFLSLLKDCLRTYCLFKIMGQARGEHSFCGNPRGALSIFIWYSIYLLPMWSFAGATWRKINFIAERRPFFRNIIGADHKSPGW